MRVIALKERGPVRKESVDIFLVGERLGTEHGVIPAGAKDPVISRTFGGVFAQSFLNVGGVFCPFQIYPAKTKRAVDKMDVTINETREHKFSAGVDDFCAHAAPPFNFWIGSDGNDLSAVDRNGLGPRLLGVLRVNVAVNDDDIRRFDDPADIIVVRSEEHTSELQSPDHLV